MTVYLVEEHMCSVLPRYKYTDGMPCKTTTPKQDDETINSPPAGLLIKPGVAPFKFALVIVLGRQRLVFVNKRLAQALTNP